MKKRAHGLPVAAILLGLGFILLGLGLTLAGPALADDASLGRVGDGVQPLSQADVQMLAEEVRVKVFPERSEVEATFTFWNRGPAVNLLVGFPQALAQAELERAEFGDDTALHDFRAWVGGRQAPVQLEKAAGGGQGSLAGETAPPEGGSPGSPALPPYPAWYTFLLSLTSGEKVEVRNTYWVKNTAWSNGEVETGYILQSGATWAGPIGRGRVELVLEGIEPYQVIGARPGNWRLEKENTYVWEFKDWEPDTDITLHFSNRPGPAAPDPAAPAGGQPAGQATFPRQEVLIGNLAATGANLRLELADGRRIEFSAPEPLDDAATGGLALVSGSWPEEGTFVAERVLSLSGDLAGRRVELRPYLNLVPGVRLFLDNRGMEHSGTLEQAHIAFRSPPFMLNYTTFVEALELTEILDLSLGYHPGSRVITWEGRGRPLKLGIGQSVYSAYRGPGQPWASALWYDGKLYVPLRFVLEHYGYQVEYDPGQNLIRAGAPLVPDAPVETLGG